ncbi:MAG: AEC family transporter [Rhodocyclaceae bacterium]|nr:AEC family transporter [Rhodocyclaceae bacterium]
MSIISALFPDFALILTGYLLRRVMPLGEHFWSGLEKLIYFVLFPALLFSAIVKTALNVSALPLIGVGAGAMSGAMVLALLIQPFSRVAPISFASLFQCAFRYNTYIGLAVAAKAHGAPGIAAMGLVAGGLVPFANLAAVWMLARHGKASVWRELAKNPLFIATVAALLWNLAGFSLPAPLQAYLGRLAEAAIALGLLAVGAALKLRGALGRQGRMLVFWLLFVKLCAMPSLAWTLGRLAGLDGVFFDIAVVFAALPTASSAYILAQRMGGDGARVAWVISASTLMGMLTLPLWLALLLGRG